MTEPTTEIIDGGKTEGLLCQRSVAVKRIANNGLISVRLFESNLSIRLITKWILVSWIIFPFFTETEAIWFLRKSKDCHYCTLLQHAPRHVSPTSDEENAGYESSNGSEDFTVSFGDKADSGHIHLPALSGQPSVDAEDRNPELLV